MGKNAATHDANRSKLCLLCFKKASRSVKTKFYKIVSNGKLEAIIKSLFDYNASDTHLPNAICAGCFRKLYRFKNGLLKKIKLPDLSQFHIMERRSNMIICQCPLCKIVRRPLFEVLSRTEKSIRTYLIIKFLIFIIYFKFLINCV